MKFDGLFLPENASKARIREAENARKNRAEIVKAHSQGQVSRRDLVKWGLITTGGLLAPIHGLNPFVSSAYGKGKGKGGNSGGGHGADDIISSSSTGVPASPLFGAQPFTQAMPRFDLLQRKPVSSLTPTPTAMANQTQQAVPAVLGGGTGPIEGRPPGAIWAHQRFNVFPAQVGMEVTQQGARVNSIYNPAVPPSLNSGIDPASPFSPSFHSGLPA